MYLNTMSGPCMADPGPKEDLAKRDALTPSTRELWCTSPRGVDGGERTQVPAEGDFRLNSAVPVPTAPPRFPPFKRLKPAGTAPGKALRQVEYAHLWMHARMNLDGGSESLGAVMYCSAGQFLFTTPTDSCVSHSPVQ